ncbi:MAG: RpoL/Rpb11 RNA polymerase subunit family protein [Candidatus Micrarchaeales archaeon]
MNIKIIEDEPKSLIIEFEGMDRAIPELIKTRLLESKDVDFVSAMKEHPEMGWPRLVVKSSKNAKSLVMKAIEQVQDEMQELKAQIPKK